MSALDDHDFMDWDSNPDPDCFGDCCKLGDEVEAEGGVSGPVCWKGWSRRDNRCRLGIKVGPGSLVFVSCRGLRKARRD